jgi:NAD(P)-dependent dehydrogenase (short-subunit alcohol dehydrogenase family)
LGLAIITGGSRGLGAAFCDLYRERGWHVVEFSRSAPHSYSVPIDLSDPEAAAHIFAKTSAALATSSPSEVVAISCAGVLGPVGPVEHAPQVEVRANLEVNVVSAILFARQFVAAFQDHRCPKTFVNISSGAATRGRAGWSLYCAGKAALESYVRAVALEQAARAHPIRAISVNPGAIDTAMQAAVRNSSAKDFPELEHYLRLHREGRLAPPSSVASRIAEIVASRPEPGRAYSGSS